LCLFNSQYFIRITSTMSSSTEAAAARLFGLQNLNALITGGTKGIGRAIAEEFVNLGARVFVCSRNQEDVDATVAALKALRPGEAWAAGIAADVAEPGGRAALVAAAAAAFGGDGVIDVLVNNVGRNVRKATAEYSEEERAGVFATNYDSAFELTKLCYPLLKRAAAVQGGSAAGGERGEAAAGAGSATATATATAAPSSPLPRTSPPRRCGASVLFNSSVAAGPGAMRSGALYASTKAALNQLARYLAAEWAPDGIRVNAVCPWYTSTELAQQVLKEEGFRTAVERRTPLGRVGEPREVAAAFAFLAGPAGRYVTGQCLGVDGGYGAVGFWPDASLLPGQGGGGESEVRGVHPALVGGEF
jgi:tropinone reductase I